MKISRYGVLAAVAGALTVVVLGPGVADEWRMLRGPDFPSAVEALASITALALGAWTCLTMSLACVPGSRRLAVALTPRALRGLMFAAVTGALTVVPAHADTVPQHDRAGITTSLEGLRLPERPLSSAEPLTVSEVVVEPGDTLWAIAARALPPGTAPARVAADVERWHAANGDVVGADPDLLHPGQRLTPPTEDKP